MKLNKKVIISVLTLLAIPLAIFVNLDEEKTINISNRAYVQKSKVIQKIPQYEEYLQTKAKLKNLLEQQCLEECDKAKDSNYSSENTSWTDRDFLQEEVAIKGQMMKIDLERNYDAYVRKYANEVYEKPTPADLQIVNLQLELLGLELEKDEKLAKEKLLIQLLESRTPSLKLKDKALNEEVRKIMQQEEEKIAYRLVKYERKKLLENPSDYSISLNGSNLKNSIAELEELAKTQEIAYIKIFDNAVDEIAKREDLEIVENSDKKPLFAKNITDDVIEYIELNKN